MAASGTPGAEKNEDIVFHTARISTREHVELKFIGNQETKSVLVGKIGLTLKSCVRSGVHHTEDKLKITFPEATLTISHSHPDDVEGRRYNVEWEVTGALSQLRDDFSMRDQHWYGGAQVRSQQWPIEKWNRSPAPYVTHDSYKDHYGGVQERYFLGSNGVALFVHDDVPLFVGINEKKKQMLTFISKFASPYRNPDNANLTMQYCIFQASNVRTAHDFATSQVFRKPTEIPDENMFKYPIWSTWAKYKKKINEKVIREFSEEILKNKFSHAQLEIDDDWTPRYGDFEFDTSKFPDAKGLIDELKRKGFRVTVWVHPFATPRAAASSSGHMIPGLLSARGIVVWWNGIGSYLDITKPDAVAWFKENLKKLQQKYGVDSFKFDAGECNYIPSGGNTHMPYINPSIYSTEYAKVALEADPEVRCQEVRVGWRTQDLPVFVRMMDKDSKWGYNNGLQTLIPHALTFSIIGYPFILPDMIGGNAYPSSAYPEKELFIRWLQANVFMPAVQFSIPPWQYDDEVINISRRMMELHEKYAGKMIELAKEGGPIIRPLWWIAPDDETAQTIDSEFLLGDDILVAPVLTKDVRQRDVYLPAGTWRDELHNEEYIGNAWYLNIKAELHELPYFTRISPKQNPELDPSKPLNVWSAKEGSLDSDPV